MTFRIRWPNVPSLHDVDVAVHLDEDMQLEHFDHGAQIGDFLMSMPVGTTIEVLLVHGRARKDQVFYS